MSLTPKKSQNPIKTLYNSNKSFKIKKLWYPALKSYIFGSVLEKKNLKNFILILLRWFKYIKQFLFIQKWWQSNALMKLVNI